MGEQPKPVDDEVERALASMRAGFLSGSQQIAAQIATLDQYLVDAPGEEREAVRAQVGRLVAAHERITAKVMSAPPSSWDSFKVMVSAVKQQQAVLDQVSHLVQQHVLPRQLENLSVTPFPIAAPPPPEEPPPPPRNELFPPQPHALSTDDGLRPASAIFRSDDGGYRPAPVPRARQVAKRPPPPRSRTETGFRALSAAGLRARQDNDDEQEERPSLLALARERTAGFRGLAAMLAVGIILSLLPRDRLQEVGTKLFELIGPTGSEIASNDPPPKPPAPAVLPRSVDRVPSAADLEAPAPAPEVKPQPKVEPKPRPSVPAPQKKVAVVSVEEPPPAPPPLMPAPKAVVAPAASEEAVAPPPAGEERFVPVVFTHKDHATVMRALTDLKQQFPSVLIGLEGEVQPVDMGKKGIWHRLVLLPAGPRPQASKVCDHLASQGYDRCYVREY
jgi:hypothetical protein